MKVTVSKRCNNKLTTVEIDHIKLFVSYETVIGFETPETGRILSENIWSQTTNKHLFQLGPKEDRIPHDKFTKELDKILN